MPQRRANGSHQLREALADGARRRIEVDQQWANIAGIEETDLMREQRQRIADLADGRAVEVATSELCLRSALSVTIAATS